MFTKIEFILYTHYAASGTLPIAATYTDLYDCELSATKMLGSTSYFGNEPKSFDFTLDYDSWLQDNIIAEANDIAREFSKYIVRVYDNDIYIFSGVLELAYFKIQYSRDKVKLRAYDWLVLLNKIGNDNFKSITTTWYLSFQLHNTPETYQKVYCDTYNVSVFAQAAICFAQGMIFGINPADAALSDYITNAIIKPEVEIDNIIWEKETINIVIWLLVYNRHYDEFSFSRSKEGWIISAYTGYAVYKFTYYHEIEDDYYIWVRVIEYNGINIVENTNVNYTGNIYNTGTFQSSVNAANTILAHGGVANLQYQLIGERAYQIAATSNLPEVTTTDGNRYWGTDTILADEEKQNIYFDIYLYCDYITNGQSVQWIDNQNITISSGLKTATIAGNGAFFITPDKPDIIQFKNKYRDNNNDFIVIADEDIIDDLEFSRMPKASINVDDLTYTISESFRDALLSKLQNYYNQFFEQINTSGGFTVSELFNTYTLTLGDKITVTLRLQTINSIKKESEMFTKIESQNYLNYVLEASNGTADFILISEDGFALLQTAF